MIMDDHGMSTVQNLRWSMMIGACTEQDIWGTSQSTRGIHFNQLVKRDDIGF